MSALNWVVEFAYLLDKDLISPTEFFEIQATQEGILFHGTATDPEFEQLCNKKVEIEGVIEEEHIRFSKNYPYYFGTDEQGKLFLDKTTTGHTVVYEGEWFEPKKHYEGMWYIEWLDDDGESYHITGPWEMKAK